MLKRTNRMLFGILLLTIITPALSQEENVPIIAVMIDVDTPALPSYNETRSAEVNLHEMYGEISRHNGTATLFLTREVTSSRIRLILAQYSVLSNFEFAVSGNQSNDRLSTISQSIQEELIKSAINSAKSAKVCGMSEVNVMGFIPPGFDQNEDTYRIMDKLGFDYNAGFQKGIIYAPGHEEDVWPYQIEGYNFFAVPIGSVSADERLLPLYDKTVAEEGVSASEWAKMLSTKIDESSANKDPVVVLFSTSVSGSDDYLDAFRQILDYAVSKNARFVSGWDLVSMAKTGTITPPEANITKCATCDQDEISNIVINVVKNTTESTNQTFENETNETT